ncbi:MAG TPA: DDE-type integrase/transposase/recombinase, partial [Candidatus Tectomicrobia bacterium]|nr:DDE-type integrase/transposase/recombinase [Candidatus Tectomicrobia bacterium]
MIIPAPQSLSPEEHRLQAVLALFKGEKASDVSTSFGICRSDLYKLRMRVLVAIREALKDHPRGPKQAHNRLAAEREQKVVSICQRHPTHSSYQVREKLGSDAPSARTKRARQRHGIARVPKRAPPSAPARRVPKQAMTRAHYLLTLRPHLGPERVVWDVQNGEQLAISTSTVKRLKRKIHNTLHPAPPKPPPPVWRFYERQHPHRLWHADFMDKITLTDTKAQAHQLTLQDDYSRGYVFCDLTLDHDQRTVIRALMAAMRQWQVIPNALLSDNGSPFKGMLIRAFCKKLGIRLIRSAVRHPQTNGKLERAFQDDMRDFYRQYDAWLLDHLRHDLPSYVHYRNYIRGHKALGGKSSITRLQEHTEKAPSSILDQLESYAVHKLGRQTVNGDGSLRVLGRSAQLDERACGQEVTLYETLQGLEVKTQEERWYLFPDYQRFRQLSCTAPWNMPASFAFERQQG